MWGRWSTTIGCLDAASWSRTGWFESEQSSLVQQFVSRDKIEESKIDFFNSFNQIIIGQYLPMAVVSWA